MNPMRYFAIGHARHVVCNPLSEAKLDELVELLALPEDARVLDIACGKGELLARAARRWKCSGVGVDISTEFAADARADLETAGLGAAVEIVEKSGSEYDGEPGSFDAALCLGASWIWGGFRGTLHALSAWARPDGLVVCGEPFWVRGPSAGYLAASGLRAESFGTHAGNVEAGVGLGLRFLHAIVASHDDWDRYEGYQWYAVERWARGNPDDPEREEILATARKARDRYLRWGRAELGWAVYIFSGE